MSDRDDGLGSSRELGNMNLVTFIPSRVGVVVQGRYTLVMGRKRLTLNPGDEYLIPKGTPHKGEAVGGTRAIHAFGGRRAERE